jgi:hypothetical protein
MFLKTLCQLMLASISMTAKGVTRFSNPFMEIAASIAHMATSNARLFRKVVRAVLNVRFRGKI